MKRHIERFGDDVVTLRLIEQRDLEHTLNWRNRDGARNWFKMSAKIAPDSHLAWFERYLGKDDDYLFIVEAAHRPVGQCAIYGIDRDAGSAEIGRFLAAPGESGKGYIRRCCALLIDFARDVLGLRYLFLEVFKDNLRARKIYAACGFVEEACDFELLRMGLKLDPDA